MGTVTSLERRRTRRVVFNILGCGRPMTLAEIAHAADQHFGMELATQDIERAIVDLQGLGQQIQRFKSVVADKYQLASGWDGGSAA